MSRIRRLPARARARSATSPPPFFSPITNLKRKTQSKINSMSGGIGAAANDITFPPNGEDDTIPLPGHTPHRRFLSFRQLNALALSIVLAASGMVSPADISIALLSFPYILFLSRFAFPPLRSSEPPIFRPDNRLLAFYITVGALLGLLLPIAYILEGLMEGDKEGIKAAVPHLFQLSCQVFLEGVMFSRDFSLPIRAFVPVSYNAMRLFALIDWVVGEMGKEAVVAGKGEWSGLRLLAGRGLALANLVFWGFNLFGFLMPVYLPRAFERHYGCKEKSWQLDRSIVSGKTMNNIDNGEKGKKDQ